MSRYRSRLVLGDGRATRSRYSQSPACATLSRLSRTDGVYKLNSSSFFGLSEVKVRNKGRVLAPIRKSRSVEFPCTVY